MYATTSVCLQVPVHPLLPYDKHVFHPLLRRSELRRALKASQPAGKGRETLGQTSLTFCSGPFGRTSVLHPMPSERPTQSMRRHGLTSQGHPFANQAGDPSAVFRVPPERVGDVTASDASEFVFHGPISERHSSHISMV